MPPEEVPKLITNKEPTPLSMINGGIPVPIFKHSFIKGEIDQQNKRLNITLNPNQLGMLFFNVPQLQGPAADKLGIDLNILSTWMSVAGINQLFVNGTYDFSTDTKATVVGINEDGSAVSGGVKAAKISKTRTLPGHRGSKSSSLFNLEIQIDGDQLASKISDENKEGMQSVEGWQAHLNEIIKDQVRKKALEFLAQPNLLDLNGEGLSFLVSIFLMATIQIPFALEGIKIPLSVFNTLTILATFLFWTYLSKAFAEMKGAPYTPSLINIAGIQPDRMAILLLSLKTHDVIVKITKDLPPTP